MKVKRKGGVIMKAMAIGKLIGVSILSFGLGVLISFFLPDTFLAVIEALVIVAIGLLFFLRPKC
jgi:hypothetical protein